jgi:SNF2 family DNA or RNA helicase
VKLFRFQEEGIRWLSRRRGAILADEAGLGKTIQALKAIARRAPVIVACPVICVELWATETKKHRPDLKVTVLQGRKSLRWPSPGEMLIVSYGNLPRDQYQLEDLLIPEGEEEETLPPKGLTLIADEANRLTPSSKKDAWAFCMLSERVSGNDGKVWLLTTKVPEEPQELWSFLQLADLNTALDNERPRIFATQSPRVIARRLQRVMLRRTKSVMCQSLSRAYHGGRLEG